MMILCISVSRMYIIPDILLLRCTFYLEYFDTRVYTLPDILIQGCTLYLEYFDARKYNEFGALLQGCTPYLIFCCKGVHSTSFWNYWTKLLMLIIYYKLTGHPNLRCHYPGCTMSLSFVYIFRYHYGWLIYHYQCWTT